ncbi:MAG: polysaccharide biosynthesis C-terminal domain-containing protein [Arenicellales bacterium]|nr:polysaccharide biosynthesis C-terminal domain-containing protein [Arenicellales bacterium]
MNTGKDQTERIDRDTHKDTKDLVRGAIVNYIGMLAKVSKLLFVLVAARVYGVPELGLYFLAWAAVDLTSKFGLWGVDRSLIRDIARYYVDQSETTKARVFAIMRFNISLAVGLSVLATAALFGLAPLIATWIFKDAGLSTVIRILAFSIPFIVIGTTFLATTKALRIMRFEVLVRQLIEPLVMFLALLALIPLDLGASGMAVAHVAGCAVGAVIAVYFAISTYRSLGWHRGPISKTAKVETIRFISPMAAMDFIYLMVTRMDVVLVGAIVNTAAAGYYGIAVEVVSLIKRVRQGFEPIVAPVVSQLFYGQKNVRLRRSYALVTRWLAAAALLPVIAMVLYPTQLLAIFSDQAVSGALALIFLAIAHGTHTILSTAESVLVMSGRPVLNMWLGLATLAFGVALCIPLTMTFGPVGTAIGVMITFICVNISRVYIVYRLYGLNPFGTTLTWPLVNGLIVFILFVIANLYTRPESLVGLIVSLALLAAIYVALYFSGPKESEEKHLLLTLKNKLSRAGAGRRPDLTAVPVSERMK